MDKIQKIAQALDESSFSRINELEINPIRGNFDARHLREIHAYIFQDAQKFNPQYRPGELREISTGYWSRVRELSTKEKYLVVYADRSESRMLEKILRDFGGPESLKGLDLELFAEKMAKFYGDLDYLHPFWDGNSRTLRVFTRQLALEAGFTLDWNMAKRDIRSRDVVYVARDKEVTDRKYPDMKSGIVHSMEEAETCIVLYKSHKDSPSLKDIIRESTTLLEVSREQRQEVTRSANRDRGMEPDFSF